MGFLIGVANSSSLTVALIQSGQTIHWVCFVARLTKGRELWSLQF